MFFRDDSLGNKERPSRSASLASLPFTKHLGFSGKPSRIALSFLAVSFLVQGLILGLFDPSSSFAASQPVSNTTSQSSADPNPPQLPTQTDKNSGTPRISYADEQKLRLQSPEDKEVQSNIPTRPVQATASGLFAGNGKASLSNMQPATKPNLNPHFAHTYYAKKTADDSGVDPGDCTSASNADCSLRAAINKANGDGHGTTSDLILMTSGGLYALGSTILPTLGNYITLSNSSTQSCPGGLGSGSFGYISVGSLPANTDILTLSSNDIVSGIELDGSKRDGFALTGSNNVLTCSTAFNSTQNGVNIKTGATNNQIGQATNGGTIGNIDFMALQNGGSGILIGGIGATGNVVKNSSIGFFPFGGGIVYPNGVGISINAGATGNYIGSTTNPQQYINLIRNNTSDGIDFNDTGTNGNFVIGNYIGVDQTGLALAGNSLNQIRINPGPINNTIGGDRATGFGNLIAGGGSGYSNIYIDSSTGNSVQGNIIGVKKDFSGPFTNGLNGVRLFTGATNIQILNNIIGGQPGSGITMEGAVNSTVYGNYIGTDPTATSTVLGNGSEGINVATASTGNQIGGSGSNQPNFIDNNAFSGININGNGTDNNKVQNNIIGVKGDYSAALSNGTSVGTRTGATVCTPGSGSGGTADVQSEDCNGVFITANGGGTGPTGTIVSGNLIAQTLGSVYPAGVLLDFSNGNTVQSNSIGARIAGGTVTGYPATIQNVGIWLINGASNNQIGGDYSQNQGNLIGQQVYGLSLNNSNFSGGAPLGTLNGNKVQGNALGVDFSSTPNANLVLNHYGLILLDNGGGVNNNLYGVDFSAATPNLKLANLVGNTGNNGYGIIAQVLTADSGNQVNGNYVGVKADGSAGSGNQFGIFIQGSTSSQVQGNYIGAANLPGATTSYGLYLNGTTSATITSNYIGTNANGDDLHNSIGVLFTNGTNKNTFSQNVVGRNTTEGVKVGSSSSDTTVNQNKITQNSIFGNGGLGINLNYTGANPNGINGGNATGPNNQAQRPTITAASYNAATATLTVSGTANPSSNVEIFLASAPGGLIPQGKFYVGAVASNSSGGAFSFSGPLSVANVTTYSLSLVATSTLIAPSAYQGSTSQFSDAFTVTSITQVLTVAPTTLNFTTPQGSNPANQTANLTANLGNVTFSSAISYGAGAGGWLTVTPSSGTVNIGTPLPVTFSVAIGNITSGSYSATVTFTDTGNSANTAAVTVNLTVPAPLGYTYYLPFLSNGAGNFTTYPVFQNVGTAASNVAVTFYDSNGAALATQPTLTGNCNPVPKFGECILPNPYNSTNSGSAIIFSPQPINVIIPEGTAFGGSAYAIGSGANGSLIAPIALNNSFGDFKTQITVYNGGSNAANVTITFYNNDGSAAPASSTKTVTIQPRTSQAFDQSAASSNLPIGFNGWAQITGNDANSQTLVAQILEQSASRKFVAIANAQSTPHTTVYAPAIFNHAYGAFTTGANIVNPGSSPVNVTVSYYTAAGTLRSTTPFNLGAHAVAGVFQGASSGNGIPSGGLPNGYIGAATVTATGGGIVMVVNEDGGLTSTGNARSGTYSASGSGSDSVGLPVIANGAFGGYITGDTIQNTSAASVSGTLSFYNLDGTIAGTVQNFTIGANASQAYFQGASSLPAGFFGTAVVTETSGPANALIVTTNAQSNSLFYTYVEPAS